MAVSQWVFRKEAMREFLRERLLLQTVCKTVSPTPSSKAVRLHIDDERYVQIYVDTKLARLSDVSWRNTFKPPFIVTNVIVDKRKLVISTDGKGELCAQSNYFLVPNIISVTDGEVWR